MTAATAPGGGKREPPACPLCSSREGRGWRDERGTPYYFCPHCDLIHLHPDYRPGRDSEEQRYLEHNNSPHEAGYIAYLSRFAEHAIYPYLPPGTAILDYGSGPAPVLAELLSTAGYRSSYYDPFFAAETPLPEGSFDGVSVVEAAEHFFHPAREFAGLRRLLRPGGYLFLRTELHDGSPEFFSRWWYRHDRTHVVFYSRRTMEYLARSFSLRLSACMRGREVVLQAI
jgi:SAM-dependent methyltransferase